MANNNLLMYVLLKSNGSVLACDHRQILENDTEPVLANDDGPVLASDTGQLAVSMQARHQLPLSGRCRKRNWASIGPLTGDCLGYTTFFTNIDPSP